MLAAVFAFIAPTTSTLHAQLSPAKEDRYVPDGTRKCIKPKDRASIVSQLLAPLACVTPVVNVSARSGNESESFVVVNPTNTNNLVAFSNLTSENSIFRGYSTDGGATWTRGTVATNVACCDGQAAWDTFGNLFLVYINNSVNQINVILSTDGGATFSAPVTVGTGSVDQPSIAVGNGSVWVDWNSGGSMVARGAPVTGLGAWGPFAAQQAIPSASGSFGGIAVGPGANGGKVIVTYQSPTGGQGPATIYANVDADGLGAGGFGARVTVTTTNVGGFDFIPAQNGRSIDAEAGVAWDATGGPFNNRIYLVYTEETVNENNDTDILLRRSTDDGATWSAPVRVNDDPASPIRSQFLPYLALDRTSGTIAVGFHDCRNDNGVAGSGGTNAIPNDDAEYFGTFSADGGVTFAPNTRLSGGFSNAAAASNGIDFGDYAGQDAHAGKLYAVWADNANCDGTNANGTLHAFDLYTNALGVGFSVTTTVPAVGSVVSTQPNDFVVNLTDAVNPATVEASDFTVNAIAANSFVLGGGNTQITFHYNSTPVTSQGVQTMNVVAGAFNKASGGDPVSAFTGTFRYDALLLQVTTTVPAVGGVFSPPAPGAYNYDVNFNEAVDPGSVQTGDLTLSGTSAASVTGVSVINANMTVRFTLNINFGGTLTANIGAAAMTDAFGNPNGAFSGNYTVQGCPPANYVIAAGADPIVPGTTDTGNHGDDVDTAVALPFPFVLYGNTYNSVNVSSNGRLDFVVANESGGYVTACLPPPNNVGPYDFTIFPLWEDMRTDSQSGCSGFPGGTCGIFTSVSGVAPNRIFNIEWRTVLFSNTASRHNFEARLYENSIATNKRFDVIFGSITTTGFNHPYVSGVMGASGFLTQDFCNVLPTQNVSRIYTNSPCAPAPSSAVSRKVHGAAGAFDIPLPLVEIGGAVGVEPRTTAVAGEHQMVVTFPTSVTLTGASVTSGTGSVDNFSGSGTAVITVNLTGVTNAQRLGVTLANVNNGTASGDVFIPMGLLAGDTSGNGSVSATDVSQTRAQSGQGVSMSNFREDVVVNGSINATDVSAVKAQSGTGLP